MNTTYKTSLYIIVILIFLGEEYENKKKKLNHNFICITQHKYFLALAIILHMETQLKSRDFFVAAENNE